MGKRKRKKIKRKIRYAIVYRVVQFLIFLSTLFPRVAWLKFCGFLGRIAYHFASSTRSLVKKHLSLAFKDKDKAEIKALSKNVFEFLGKNTGEMLRATATIETLDDLNKVVTVHGYENFEQAFAKRKGVIFLTSHI